MKRTTRSEACGVAAAVVAAATVAAVAAAAAAAAKIQPNQESDVGAALSILIWFALTIISNENRTWCVF